jgi:hypothetical protein
MSREYNILKNDKYLPTGPYTGKCSFATLTYTENGRNVFILSKVKERPHHGSSS